MRTIWAEQRSGPMPGTITARRDRARRRGMGRRHVGIRGMGATMLSGQVYATAEAEAGPSRQSRP